jgi:1-acyl-sn-glycerol-3-phosphate acyltransferase
VLNEGVALRTAALAYSVEDREVSVAKDVCWWGDALLAPHLWKLAGLKGVRARVQFGEVIEERSDRFALSQGARARIEEMYSS